MSNITSNISSLSNPNLVGIAKSQLKGKVASKQTLLSNADILKSKIKDLQSKIKITQEEYNNTFKKLQEDFKSGNIKEEEYNQKYNQFQNQLQKETKLIQEEIEKFQNTLSDSFNDIFKNIKSGKKKLNNNIKNNISFINKEQTKSNLSRNVKVLKNASPIKDKIASVLIGLLTNIAISIVKKNSKLQELVDKTNNVIDNADTVAKINVARVLRDNALKIINNQEQKILRFKKIIEKIQRIIQILTTIIRIIQIILKLGSPIPIPLPVKIKLQPILQKVLTILGYLSIGVSIALAVLNSIIGYLEYLKSLLKQIGNIIELKIVNPLISLDIIDEIRSSVPSLLIDSYKGFKFAIREENNPQFVVRGFKRHYAVAIDTNNVEVLKSDLSFTQDPQDLIDTLKVIIDREDLIA